MWMKHALCRCVIVAISDDKLRPDQKRRTQAGKINVNNRPDSWTHGLKNDSQSQRP